MANQKIQKIKVSNSEYDLFVKKDWQENDPNSVSYIENRTHYDDDNGDVVQLDPKYIPIDNDTIKVDTDGKINVKDLADTKLDKAPDGSVELLDENQKINPHYLSDAIVGQMKYAGIINDYVDDASAYKFLTSPSASFTSKLTEIFDAELDLGTVEIEVSSTTNDYKIYCMDVEGNYLMETLDSRFEGFYFIANCDFDTSNIPSPELTFFTGDWLVVSNGVIAVIDNTDTVRTVNSKIGNVKIALASGNPAISDIAAAGSNITLSYDESTNITTIAAKDTTYTADNELLKLDGTKFTTNIIHKGTAENSLKIFEGNANAKHSVALGSAEIPSDFKSLAGSFTTTAPTASAEASFAAGTSSKAVSTGAVAFGVADQAGITGYYWSDISTTGTTTTITLATERKLIGTPAKPSSTDWEEGDLVSVVNDSKYPLCGVIATKPNAYTITIENCPFTESNYGGLSSLALAPDDKTIFAVKREYDSETHRAKLTPRTGSIQLGWCATVFGAMNIGGGTFSQTFGWNNITAGDFGLTAGRDNTTGYASATFGWNNENAGSLSILVGKDLKLKRNCSSSAGFGKDHILENDAVFAAGSTHTIKSYAGSAIGSSNLVNGYASTAIGLALETNRQSQLVVGQFNDASAMNANGTAQFVVGNGESRDATANAFIVYRDGRAAVSADPEKPRDIVSLNYFNTNIGDATTTELNDIKADVDELETFKANLSSALIPVYTNNAAATTGYNSVIIGETTGHSVTREYNLSVGQRNTIGGPRNLVSGSDNVVASGRHYTFIAGQSNTINQSYAAAIGRSNVIQTAGTFAIGLYNKTYHKTGQFVVGRGNKVEQDAMFIVGNNSAITGGTTTYTDEVVDAARSNAFVVWADGRATVGRDPSGNMDVATKQYVDSHVPSIDLSRVDQDVNIVNGHNLTVDGDVTINGDLEFNGDIAFGNFRASTVNADEMYVAGKKVLVEGDTVSGGTASFPTTAADGSALQEGAVLVYRGGQWVAENPPTTIYTGEVE